MGLSRLGMCLSIFLSVLEESKGIACPLVVKLDFSVVWVVIIWCFRWGMFFFDFSQCVWGVL